ncbi:hypothetical protein O0I10_011086 [Lichtheimia ornata]|uniref:Uncharacterized protein n=1 Tax=Lichtheimia ornata TaxID=688661 RepID=A0AAD7UTG4_9FUNG|nr:uncharacterized protein O0I10_011086 [Lichtheimia ornata]KAJ8653238.1 hypothetical protein O0I10_011086 [Lichtheimia ornata]
MARKERDNSDKREHVTKEHEIPFDVFHMETSPSNGRPPKLEKQNLLSLVYYADEQRIANVRQGNTNEMHRAQRILLDTLHVLHKGALCTNNDNTTTTCTRRFQEGVIFASQVLRHGYYIRHLDSNEQKALRPLADRLYTALQEVRRMARAQALAHLTHPTHLLTTRLNELMHNYDTFESALYASYSRAVFGDSKSTLWQNATNQSMTNHSNPLPAELFCDALTQLLPMTLDRALTQKLVTLDILQELDPVAFIALPRLAVLAGTTWLSHISHWRKHHQHPCLVAWFNTGGIQHDMVTRLLNAVEQLESTASPAAFMEHHLRIERALVYGWDDQPTSLESTIYTHVCAIADGLRVGNNARSFNMVLRHLFSPFHPPQPESTQYDDMYPESVSENTVLELAI